MSSNNKTIDAVSQMDYTLWVEQQIAAQPVSYYYTTMMIYSHFIDAFSEEFSEANYSGIPIELEGAEMLIRN